MSQVQASEPILPPSNENPVGGTALIRAARVETNRAIQSIQNWLLSALEGIPTRRIEINTTRAPFLVNQTKYEYLVSLPVLQQIIDELKRRYAEPAVSEPIVSRAVAAYEIGTAAAVTNFAAITAGEVTRQLSQVLASDPWQRRVALVRARVFEQMAGFGGESATDLARVLMTGIENGQNPLTVAKTLRERFDVSKSRAERIARTEITGALRRARWDETDALGAEVGIRTRMLWISALSPTSRATHVAKSGGLYTTEEVREFYSADGNAINCYLPGTMVRGRFKAGSKAHYTGDAVRIVTASGRNLCVTPNHPVMTDSGLVAAGKLTKGDNLIAYIAKDENLAGVCDLNSELAYSSVEDVFCSLTDIGHSYAAGVRAIDFHGDAEFFDKDIEIVDSARVLPCGIDASGAQLLDNFGFVATDSISAAGGSLGLDSDRVNLPAPFYVGLARKFTSIFRGGFFHANKSAFGSVAPAIAGFFKPAVDAYSRCAAFFANLKNRLSSNMLPVHVGNIKSGFVAPYIAPVRTNGSEKQADSLGGNSAAISDILHSFAGLVSVDKIVSIESFGYSGHVYDLEEESGVMIAGNLITSNCKCSQTAVVVDADGQPIVDRAIKRVRAAKERYRAQEGSTQ